MASSVFHLPAAGRMVGLSPSFDPPLVRGVNLYPDDPLKFDFIIDRGDEALPDEAFKQESQKLIKYFLAALTVPEDQMWVNLSPYEEDDIIPDSFGQTEMGRELLAQDYLLKQLTASLMYPEDDIGKRFWSRVYDKAYERFGTVDIPMDTFNKVWIVPATAKVYEHDKGAFVVESRLKVLLEEDYVAREASSLHRETEAGHAAPRDAGKPSRSTAYTEAAAQIIREVIIPEIEREVNEGRAFAELRQIYHSVILAVWYKQALKESLLGQVYVNQGKTKGVDFANPQDAKEQIYEQYLEAFRKGAYNYIRQDYDPVQQTVIPRRYFSGGVELVPEIKATEETPPAEGKKEPYTAVTAQMTRTGNTDTGSQPAPAVKRKKAKKNPVAGAAYSHKFDQTQQVVAAKKDPLLDYARRGAGALGLKGPVKIGRRTTNGLVYRDGEAMMMNGLLTTLVPDEAAGDDERSAFQVFITDVLRQAALSGEAGTDYPGARQRSYQYFARREKELRQLLDFIDRKEIAVNEVYRQALREIQQRQFTDFDKQRFVDQGNHYTVDKKLGSHVIKEGHKVIGTYFAVWAPHARQAFVEIYGAPEGAVRHPMNRWDLAGVWQVYIPEVQPGTRYKIAFEGANGERLLKRDPYARFAEYPDARHALRTASIVTDVDSFVWDDDQWMENRKKQTGIDRPFSVYEMQMETWRRHGERTDESGQPDVLTYRELAPELTEHILELGFTHVEFFPPAEQTLTGTGSYGAANVFAPHSRYGTPEDLKYLINYLHDNGIGVIMDWAPAHYRADADGLAWFDGTELYGFEDPRRGDHPQGKTKIPNYQRHEVASYYLSNVRYWLDEFHIDGLRVDAVESMLYLNYGRQEGQWIPNEFGDHRNLGAMRFLQDVNTFVHQEFPGVVTIAAESSSWPGATQPVASGDQALGFDYQWVMGWMKDTLQYMAREPGRRPVHRQELTRFFEYAFKENSQLAISHDEVIKLKGSLLDKMPGDQGQKFANLRLLLSWLYTTPGAKLNFMGGEFGQWGEWNAQQGREGHRLDETHSDAAYHRGMQKLMRDLNALYRKEAALYELNHDPKGFDTIDFRNAEQGLISFIRKDVHGEEIVVVLNFTTTVYKDFRIGLPDDGYWTEVFNSDALQYGGSGVANPKEIRASSERWHGQPYSVTLDNIPPLGMVAFKRVAEDDLGIDLDRNRLIKKVARELRTALMRYEDTSKEKRTRENRAFRYLEAPLMDGEAETFKNHFGLLAKIAESRSNKGRLSAADLTALVYELAEQHDDQRAEIKQMLTDLARTSGDTTVRDVAQKVHRWMDVGHIVLVAPESKPFIKGGGLANVVGELAAALVRSGLKADVIMPGYQKSDIDFAELKNTGKTVRTPLGDVHGFAETQLFTTRANNVGYKFLVNPDFADGLYTPASNTHDSLKMVFLSLGSLEAMKALHLYPSIVVGNDWMTAPLMAHLNSQRSLFKKDPHFANVRTIGMVHNNGYQRKMPRYDGDAGDLLAHIGLPPEDYGWFIDPHNWDLVNPLHAFIRHAHVVVPVSPGQLEDFVRTDDKGGAEGFMLVFQELLADRRLAASVNGIDQIGIQRKRFGVSFQDVDPNDPDAQQNMLALQKEKMLRDRDILATQYPDLWRTEDGTTDQLGEDTFVMSFVSRIAEQKGFHYAAEFVRRVLTSGEFPQSRFLFAGKSPENEQSLQDLIYELTQEFPGRVGYVYGLWVNDKNPLYDLLYGAPDIFGSPSVYEPGGISPKEAMARGGVPFMSNVQGQKTTLETIGENGFGFEVDLKDFEKTVAGMVDEYRRAYDIWERRDETPEWNDKVFRNLMQDWTWDQVVDDYVESILKHTLGLEDKYYKDIVKKSSLAALQQRYLGYPAPGIQDELTGGDVEGPPGGIDLNPRSVDLQVERRGKRVDVPVDPALIRELQNAEGFVPVIIHVAPVTNLLLFLGLSDDSLQGGPEGEKDISRYPDTLPVNRLSRFYAKQPESLALLN